MMSNYTIKLSELMHADLKWNATIFKPYNVNYKKLILSNN